MDKKYVENQASILINHYNSKRFTTAVQKGKVMIKKFPNQLIFYNATALSLSALGKNYEAIDILKVALNLSPKNIYVLNNLGLIRSNLNQNREAREYLERAISIKENFMDALLNLGNLDLKEGKTESAKKNLYKALEQSNSSDTDITINMALGNMHQQMGNFEKAKKNFEIVSKIDQGNTAADKSISTMHRYLKSDDPHLILMIKKLEKIKDDENLKLLYFAIGKAYEDIENYKESFKYLELGNNIADKQINYNTDNDKNLFPEIKRIFKTSIKNKITDSNKKIIFILGMPRSGTTLVEQVVSSHKNVYGGGELSYMEDAIKKMLNYKAEKSKNLYESFKNLPCFDYKDLKIAELEYTEKLKSHVYNEEFITDKAPLNFRWIGFIKLIFPNSKIIHCCRNSMDICYSNFKNSFSGSSLGFCYNMKKLGNYFNMYKNLMSFWNNELKDKIYNLSYENLIINKDEEVKKLLNFCSLDWDENCLNPHKNKKPVGTASLAQIRAPIYRSSINKWKNVDDELNDLKKIIL
tara:strand:+ start:1307 stop:2881 length:1575 start_codon:yes stop_codon:yes gene_type:complete